jgi:hypothetical protein
MIPRIVGLALILAAAAQVAASAPCDMKPAGAAQRVFAQVDEKHAWREFPKIENVPSLDLQGGVSAEVWNEAGVALLVRTVQPGEDFWIYTKYCFAENGPLVYCDLEVRTAWGWGYHAEGPFTDGRFRPASERFFDTEKNQSIPIPQDTNDISDSLKPTIYADTGRLPFWKLIEKRP